MPKQKLEDMITVEFPVPLYMAKSIAEAYLGMASYDNLKKLTWKAVRALAETEDNFVELNKLTQSVKSKKWRKK